MKNLLVLAVALSGILLSSCGHKDDKAKPKDQIIGTWNGTKLEVFLYQGDNLVNQQSSTISDPDYFIVEFKSGKVVTISQSVQGEEDHETGYYIIQGNRLTVGETENDPDADIYTYSIHGNALEIISTDTYTEDNQTYTYEEHNYFQKQ